MPHIADRVFPEEIEFPFALAAVYYRDTRWHNLYGSKNTEPGWRVDARENYLWWSDNMPSLECPKTEERALEVVRQASWDSASPEEHVRFALAHPEEAARLLELYGEPKQ